MERTESYLSGKRWRFSSWCSRSEPNHSTFPHQSALSPHLRGSPSPGYQNKKQKKNKKLENERFNEGAGACSMHTVCMEASTWVPSSCWSLFMYKIWASTNHINPFINNQQISPLKKLTHQSKGTVHSDVYKKEGINIIQGGPRCWFIWMGHRVGPTMRCARVCTRKGMHRISIFLCISKYANHFSSKWDH